LLLVGAHSSSGRQQRALLPGCRRPQTSRFYDTNSVWGAANDEQIEHIVAASKAAHGPGAARLARVRGAAHYDFTGGRTAAALCLAAVPCVAAVRAQAQPSSPAQGKGGPLGGARVLGALLAGGPSRGCVRMRSCVHSVAHSAAAQPHTLTTPPPRLPLPPAQTCPSGRRW
jgi:hypothetical protein